MNKTNWQEAKALFHEVVDLTPAGREAFLSENCPDENLRREIEDLLVNFAESEDFISQPAMVGIGLLAADKTRIGEQIGHYKIVREIGRGGMGAVYLGVRASDDFNQQVALKIVKRGMDTDFILQRFYNERRILAGLNHPNIARLFEGGTTPDSLPYFVMEYVEGKDLLSYCNQNYLNLQERLNLFRQVCSAVSYAHQNLVVHRDLKPSNILVTADGTPKLLDFGIAKILNHESDEAENPKTSEMFRLMTPEYASPEQIRGERITTAADVYSLGVILYELLSGKNPFRRKNQTPNEWMQEICETIPEKPSNAATQKNADRQTQDGEKTNPKSEIRNPKSLRGDLDNIILKALQKELSHRYLSVQELSEDIRRYLVGLPVTAQADTFVYRAAKFIKRHRIGALAASLVLFSLIGGISATAWQAHQANIERAKAEQRFNQVRKLAKTVLFEYHDGIEKLAGSTPMREKMVKDALEYLDNLAVDSTADIDLQRELAEAYQKVGDVQGNPYSANLGNQDGALESYGKSFAIRQKLLSSDADNIQTHSDLAQSYEKIGDILWAKGKSAEAQASYQEALKISLELLNKNNLSDISGPQRLYNRIGQTQEQAGDFDAALENYQAALKASEDLVTSDPANVKYCRALSVGYGKIGDVYYQKHDYQKASENYQQSLPIIQKLSADEPTNTTLSRNFGLICARVALAEMEAGNYSEAIKKGQQAITIQREISAADPNNIQIQNDLSDTLANLGETYGRMGNLALASETFTEAISISRQFLDKNSNYALARSNFANTYLTFAKILLKNGKTDQALENFRQALIIFDPANAEPSEELAGIYQGIGDSLMAGPHKPEKLNEAKTMYQKSLDVLRKLPKANIEAQSVVKTIEEKLSQCEAKMK